MFCSNCGTQNADEVKFCSNCGAPLQSASQQTTVLNQYPIQSVQPIQPVPQKPKSNKKLIGIAGGAAALLIVIISVIAGISSSCNNTVKSFFNAYLDFDFAKAEKYCLLDQSDVIKTYCKYNGEDIEDVYDEISDDFYLEFGKKERIKDISDFYSLCGEYTKKQADKQDIDLSSFKAEIVSKEKINLKSQKEMDKLIDEIVYDCDPFSLITEDSLSDYIDIDKISKAYKVNVKIKFENKYGKDKIFDDQDIYVVKYKGKWRIVSDVFGLM